MVWAASLSYTCTYDKLNRLTSVTYDNGTVITYAYDTAGNMTGTTVTASRSILLTAPNGGQSWAIGTNRSVTWTSVNLGSAVDILLSRDAGKTWTVLWAATADDGAETWLVTGPASAGCRIRVRSATHQGIRDDSDADFAIAADSTPPDTGITDAFCGGSIVGSTATCHWTGSDDQTPEQDLQFAFRLDDGTWSPFGPDTFATFYGLSFAAHTVEAIARDAARNLDPTPAACTFTLEAVDLTPPETEITSTFCGNTIETDSVTVDWTGTDNVTPTVNLLYAWQLDATGWSDYFSNTSHLFGSLAEGPHTVSVRARDAAGNVDASPASCAFTVQLPVVVDGDVNGDGFTDSLDLVIMLDVVAGNLAAGAPPCTNPMAGDFDESGVLDAPDCVALADLLAGNSPLP